MKERAKQTIIAVIAAVVLALTAFALLLTNRAFALADDSAGGGASQEWDGTLTKQVDTLFAAAKKKDLTWADTQWKYGNYGGILNPDQILTFTFNGAEYLVAETTVPEIAGTLFLRGWAWFNNSGGNGACAAVCLDSDLLVGKEGSSIVTVENGAAESFFTKIAGTSSTAGGTIEVKGGEKLRLVADANKGDPSYDYLRVLLYAELTPAAAVDGTPELNGWTESNGKYTLESSAFATQDAPTAWTYYALEGARLDIIDVPETAAPAFETTATSYNAENSYYADGDEYVIFGNSDFSGTPYPSVRLMSVKHTAVLTYTATTDGVISMGFPANNFWVSGMGGMSNGIGVTAMFNDKLLVERTYIAEGTAIQTNAALNALNGKSIAVKEGDKLYFAIDPNGSTAYKRIFFAGGLTVTETANGEATQYKLADLLANPTAESPWSISVTDDLPCDEMDIPPVPDEPIANPEKYEFDVSDAQEVTFEKYDEKFIKYNKSGKRDATVRLDGENYLGITKSGNDLIVMGAKNDMFGVELKAAETGKMVFYDKVMFRGGSFQGNFMGVTVYLNGKAIVDRFIVEGKNEYKLLAAKYIDVNKDDVLAFVIDSNGDETFDNIIMDVRGYIIPTDTNKENVEFNLYNSFTGIKEDLDAANFTCFFCPTIEIAPAWDKTVTVGEVDSEAVFDAFDKFIVARDLTWKSAMQSYGTYYDPDFAMGKLIGNPGADWLNSYRLTFEEDGRALIDPASMIETFSVQGNGVSFYILFNDSKYLVKPTALGGKTDPNQLQLVKGNAVPVFEVKKGDTLRIVVDGKADSTYDQFIMEMNIHFAKEGEDYTKTYSTRYDFGDKGYAADSAWQAAKIQLSDTADTGKFEGHEAEFFNEPDDPDNPDNPDNPDDPGIIENPDKPGTDTDNKKDKGCGCGGSVSVAGSVLFAVIVLGTAALLIKRRACEKK